MRILLIVLASKAKPPEDCKKHFVKLLCLLHVYIFSKNIFYMDLFLLNFTLKSALCVVVDRIVVSFSYHRRSSH